MTPADLQKFTRAIQLAQTGQKVEAHSILAGLALQYPDDTKLLLWLAFTASDLRVARTSLDKLARLSPTDPALPGAQSWLAAEEARQPVSPVATTTTLPPPPPAARPQSIEPDRLTGQLRDNNAPKDRPVKDNPRPELIPESTRRRRVLTILLIASPVVIILALGLVFFTRGHDLTGLIHGTPTPDDKDRVVIAGLPVYENAQRLYLTAADRSKFTSTYSQLLKSALPPNATVTATTLEAYTTKDAIGKVFNFYSIRLKDWTNLSSLEATHSFRRPDKVLMVANVPLVKLDLTGYDLTTSDSVFVVLQIAFK